MRSFRSKGKAMEQFKAKLLTVFTIGLFTGLVLHGVYTGKPSGVLIITDNLLEYNRMGSLSIKYLLINDSENFIIHTGLKSPREKQGGERLFKQELVISINDNSFLAILKNGEKVYTKHLGEEGDFSTDIGVKVRVTNPGKDIIDRFLENTG